MFKHFLLFFLMLLNLSATPATAATTPSFSDYNQPPIVHQGGVNQNGRLQVIGTQLCNADGQPVVLRGMSSHGLQCIPPRAVI